jgi:formylglycine-generating enzyme required for sulfatase activity
MKRIVFGMLVSMIGVVIATACDDDKTGGRKRVTDFIVTVESVQFKMMLVPGNLDFPSGVDDSGEETLADAYFIGETEVTYELWSEVYEWAVYGTGLRRRRRPVHFCQSRPTGWRFNWDAGSRWNRPVSGNGDFLA